MCVKLARPQIFTTLRTMTTLLIATRNAHKVGEIRAMLGGSFQLLTLKDFPEVPTVVEDAETFAGNARKKADSLANWLAARNSSLKFQMSTPAFVLADDSGLEVDALNGAPGVHSARFAALDKSANAPDADNNAKLLRLLKNIPLEKRTGRFRCVMALVEIHAPISNVQTQIFDGTCAGRIQFAASGAQGFGYDPLFVPDGFSTSFAELGEEVKNKISHRAQALEQLKVFLKAA